MIYVTLIIFVIIMFIARDAMYIYMRAEGQKNFPKEFKVCEIHSNVISTSCFRMDLSEKKKSFYKGGGN